VEISELRARQAPLKQRYRDEPAAARTAISATADWRDPGITTTVDGWGAPVRAGLHPATGGDGTHACSADMLLQALLGCAGVTLRSVATAMRLELGAVRLRAEGYYDARGTLGLDRAVPVGVRDLVVTIEASTAADEASLAKLAELTERYCVVAQSLAERPRFVIRRV
jgi:uncharacterized OsmC-like protein